MQILELKGGSTFLDAPGVREESRLTPPYSAQFEGPAMLELLFLKMQPRLLVDTLMGLYRGSVEIV